MVKSKNVLIAGGKGFLGQSLQAYFQELGFCVRILTRHPQKQNEVYWDGQNLGDWIAEIEWADILINLAGKSVDCRYTEANKKAIIDSRVDSTHILAVAIKKAEHKPQIWLNSSSATIYVHAESTGMTEDQGVIGDDFSMNVCKAWEKEFFKHDLQHTRRVALRTSIVLGNDGGAYPKLKGLVRFFMGGYQGNGRQYVSWIHVLDFCRAIDHIIHHPELVGPVNIVAPNPVPNKTFMRVLRKSLKRHIGLNQPKWFLELGAKLIGTETELLLKSRRVIPEYLLEAGFQFQYQEINAVFAHLNSQ